MIIKKLNGLFHKHGRVLFGLITIVIIISFVGFLVPGQFYGCGAFNGPEGIVVGQAFGKDVTYADLQNEMRKTAVLQQVYTGGYGQEMTPEQAFYTYCITQAAKRRGIAPTQEEVVALIQRSPILQTNGKFDIAKYKTMLENLRKNGVTANDVEEAFGDFVLQNKLQEALTADIVVTADEIENFYRQQNAGYVVRTATFNPADFTAQVKPDAEKLAAYFAANSQGYQIAGNVSGVLVEFPFANYRKAAETEATERKVKETEKAKFLDTVSRELAMRAAYDFSAQALAAVNAVPATDRFNAFKKELAKSKGVIVLFEKAAFDSEVIGGKKLPGLAAKLAAAHKNKPVSDVIAGENAAYVGFVRESIASRQASQAEVAKEVERDFREAEAANLARQAAEKAVADLAAIADPAARQKAYDALKNCKFTTFEFSLEKMPEPTQYLAASVAMSLTVGQFSPALPTGDGGSQIVELVKRNTPDMGKLPAMAKEVELNCRRHKAMMAMTAFQEELESACAMDQKALER